MTMSTSFSHKGKKRNETVVANRNNSSTATGGKAEFKGVDAGKDQFDIENKKPLSSDGKKKRGKQLYFLQNHPSPYLLLDEMLDHGKRKLQWGL